MLDENTFLSVEEALNDLPQFMAGVWEPALPSVTSLQAANGLDNGRGSEDVVQLRAAAGQRRCDRHRGSRCGQCEPAMS